MTERQHIVFRCDASMQIGSGHVVRCLTLASQLHKQGIEITFVCRELPGNLFGMVESAGHRLIRLSSATTGPSGTLKHADWLGTSQVEDARQTLAALQKSGQVDWIIVDHYALDLEWETEIRTMVKRLMVIDDLADRQHDCDILLDQNFYSDMNTRYFGKVPEHCLMLFGPRYALLREEFEALHERVKPRTGEIHRILVFFGGVDGDNFTARAIDALTRLDLKEVHVDVVIGAQHPHRLEIERACAASGFTCHIQTARMAELMAAADLAIGAGGSATWERCCLGLPVLAFSVADNQTTQIRDAAERGLLISANVPDDLVSTICRQVQALTDNPSLLRLISKVASDHVDGKGVFRTLAALGTSNIKIRRAAVEDSPSLFSWRNHSSIRAASRNQAELDWARHCNWFEQSLRTDSRELLIGELGTNPVGVVRFDIDGDVAEVSIYLVPDAGLKGQGRNLLLAAEQWLNTHRPKVKHLDAGVLGDNIPSQKLFLGAEYKIREIYYTKEL